MTVLSVRSLCVALLLTPACLPERGKAPPTPKAVAAKDGKAATKAGAGPAAGDARGGSAVAPLVGPPPAGSASGCSGAALTMPKGTVVARIEGKDVTVDDLGPELVQAEQSALRTYCQSVTSARQGALDNLLQQKLLTAAAEAEGKELNAFVQGRIEAEVPTPDDAAILAFYEANKSPSAPPLEMVKDQVIQAMQGQGGEKVLSKLLDDLRAKAKVERMLPDVSPPPMDLRRPVHAAFAGPEDAVVQVTEFSDFECPYCSRAAETLSGLKSKYAGKPVQFVFRNFPLSFHPNARPAAEYAQCAQEQGKFWAMHDGIFARQSELSVAVLKEVATAAGLDAGKLDACLAGGGVKEQIEEDMRKAQEVGVGGTPSFFVNGQTFAGNPTVEGLSEAIDAELSRLQG
ncbi:thioredoxin domain-containing protein [Nannocystis sp.]|uniref:thioredoxin domain-containing protein n=1 Tax=Nannocystis sp. TaxID=1962667 RepID=UPI00242999DE|nr:thioredoxin domain-containing protein [Nannocystis sp.]MBK7824566.1 thioredoxin domain-containing protein [Nannocystis sp.]MBK9753182.1 thioredoxin domain-containing protein [Nannocystis sp.]